MSVDVPHRVQGGLGVVLQGGLSECGSDAVEM